MEDYKKKYKEALGWMQSLYNGLHGKTKEEAEHFFPELKESEDERVRKDVISFVEQATDAGYGIISKERKEKWIVWLEKQGEKLPANKVEPKFKVGDWIISSEGTLRHILAVDKTGYQTDYGWLTHDIYDNTYHLWTIQDARKGDILQANKCTLIFDSLTKDMDGNTVISSWYYCDTETFYGMGTCKPDLWVIEGIVPATKEQYDHLFQKMEEAGYYWDNENKELKKINWNDLIKYNPNAPSIIEENSAWSEEDEKRLLQAIIALEGEGEKYLKDYGEARYKDIVTWLKSLENRLKGEQL